ncbi:beta-ketoacyl-[acyl-carrier-protein] synthase family protein [Aeoliella mucimassa]|uniref:3-oxoacyl-[acyl-carrier-protein] synthase 2 n=1 Tax=Aeoliella mucimassa TaxID=2527972 RepID=A0A518AIW1_9BACT|nr:beta-ketoacyl synthase N-terminal-like domain-containing protein [Aeoliella mucimassa]QDU54640.1 3-oxoacyl-[acyl-carrier-protein] synthase 2 [Aeoliella mucimassa]
MSTSQENNRRVVITGIGLVSPLGSSLDTVGEALATGKSAVVACDTLPEAESLPLRYAGECRQFTGHIDDFGELPKEKKKSIRKALKVMCRETQMAVAAAELAVASAGIESDTLEPERSGIVLGSDYMLTLPEDYVDGIKKCTGESGEFEFGDWGTTGLGQMTPLWMLKYLPNMPASHVAILNDLRGPNNSLTLREAASNAAVGEAFTTIARGHADFMLAGATGTRILPMQAIHAMQTEELATEDCDPATASRPFAANRIGMVAGEGSGVLVLEERSKAEARGATIYGEIVGIGSSMVADRQLHGNTKQALINAIKACLRDSKLAPGDIGHINAYGLGTKECDADEAAAIREALGDAGSTVPVTALKSYFGNLGAGSGVVELACSLLAAKQGKLPAVLNCAEPDAECGLKIATANDSPGSSFLKLSVTPQGQASALAILLT